VRLWSQFTKSIGEITDKAADRILEPYSLATESEYERVGTIVRKALFEQDRESRADERRRLASGRMLKVAMKKAAELGI
jgi:Arc/MetJ family transcription regulator